MDKKGLVPAASRPGVVVLVFGLPASGLRARLRSTLVQLEQ
jgi:hypothetical protein